MNTKTKTVLLKKVNEAFERNKRLVAPLVGFPGLNLTGSSIKLAQQNHSEHFMVVKGIVERFNPDLVFPLMDLSVEANAIGLNTLFPVDDSATVDHKDFQIDQLERMSRIDISSDARVISYINTMRLMKENLPGKIFRGAYVSGPFTLAGQTIGAEEAAMATITQPEQLDVLCEFSKNIILKYVGEMIASGAQTICILEPSAAMLGPEEFQRFSADHVSEITRFCSERNVDSIFHICGNTMHIIELMAETGVSALSLDSKEAGVDLPKVAKTLTDDVVIIGNINPTGNILTGNPEDVRKETLKLLDEMNLFSNFILSTGCDLPQNVPLENIDAFIKTGRSYSIS